MTASAEDLAKVWAKDLGEAWWEEDLAKVWAKDLGEAWWEEDLGEAWWAKDLDEELVTELVMELGGELCLSPSFGC